MNNFAIERILSDVPLLEGNLTKAVKISGDRGGWTQGGISSRAYPDLAKRIKTGNLSESEVLSIYRRDYLEKIESYSELSIVAPWLLALLFYGKIHGSGDEHVTEVVQLALNSMGFRLKVDGLFGPNTARAFLSLDSDQLIRVRNILDKNVSGLKQRRVKSVGVPSLARGIESRIDKAFAIASSFDALSETQSDLESMSFEHVSIGGTQFHLRNV